MLYEFGRLVTEVKPDIVTMENVPAIQSFKLKNVLGDFVQFGHPDQDRAISAREAALLQTFPMSYKFFEDEEHVSLVKASRYIGNAVPPV